MHTPLDGLPYYPEVRYIFCGRDPRDAFLSFVDHCCSGLARCKQTVGKRPRLAYSSFNLRIPG